MNLKRAKSPKFGAEPQLSTYSRMERREGRETEQHPGYPNSRNCITLKIVWPRSPKRPKLYGYALLESSNPYNITSYTKTRLCSLLRSTPPTLAKLRSLYKWLRCMDLGANRGRIHTTKGVLLTNPYIEQSYAMNEVSPSSWAQPLHAPLPASKYFCLLASL